MTTQRETKAPQRVVEKDRRNNLCKYSSRIVFVFFLSTNISVDFSNSRRPPDARGIQNFLLVWIDGNIDEINNEDCRNSITKLRQVVNNVNKFTDMDEFIEFISDIEQEKTFKISSGAFGQTIVPKIHDKSQVSTIYIFFQSVKN
jgi:hypothetical protein